MIDFENELMVNNQFLIPFKHTINGQTTNLCDEIKILGVIMDKYMLWRAMINYIEKKINSVNARLIILYKKQDLNTDAKKILIQSMAVSLINYAIIIYSCIDNEKDLEKLRVKYNKLHNALNHKAYTVPMIVKFVFNGIQSFKSLILQRKSVFFSRFIRLNKNNELATLKNEWIREIIWNYIDWNINPKDPWYQIPRKYRKSPIFQAFIAAKILNNDDIKYLKKGRFLRINNIHFNHNKLPDFITYNKTPWDDQELDPNDLTIFIDGSIRFLNKDNRSHIYGHGGAGLVVYHHNEIVMEQIFPYSARTTIDKCEFAVFLEVFLYIIDWIKIYFRNNKSEFSECQIIKIISDSKTALNILTNEYKLDDEININLYNKIYKQLDKIKNKNTLIELRWVEAHKNCDGNNYVDVLAKIASEIATYLDMNANNFVAFRTIKRMIRYNALIYDEEIWNKYILNTTWSTHLNRWNIAPNIKFKKELKYFNQKEQNIRMLLYSNHLELNQFLHSKNMHQIASPYCDQCTNNKYESLRHYFIECTSYKNQRLSRNKQISIAYNEHNNNQKEEKYKIKFDENKLKMMIFPSFKIKMNVRIKIITASINYIIKTKRFPNL